MEDQVRYILYFMVYDYSPCVRAYMPHRYDAAPLHLPWIYRVVRKPDA